MLPVLQAIMHANGFMTDKEFDNASVKKDKAAKGCSLLALNRQRAQILHVERNRNRIAEMTAQTAYKAANTSQKQRNDKVKAFKKKQHEELKEYMEKVAKEAKERKMAQDVEAKRLKEMERIRNREQKAEAKTKLKQLK